jgi:integrase
MGYKGKQTGHGFRTLARTALGESGERWEVLEAMLSHVVSNLTAASYIRTDYFEERRGTMQKWADYLDNAVSDIDVAN